MRKFIGNFIFFMRLGYSFRMAWRKARVTL